MKIPFADTQFLLSLASTFFVADSRNFGSRKILSGYQAIRLWWYHTVPHFHPSYALECRPGRPLTAGPEMAGWSEASPFRRVVPTWWAPASKPTPWPCGCSDWTESPRLTTSHDFKMGKIMGKSRENHGKMGSTIINWLHLRVVSTALTGSE